MATASCARRIVPQALTAMQRGTSPTPLLSTEAETNAGTGHERAKQPRAGDRCAGSHERARFVRMGTSVDRSSTQSISEALSLHYASHGIAVESVTVVADPGRSSTAKETWSVRIVFADAATAAAIPVSVAIDLDGATSQMVSTPYRPESHDALFHLGADAELGGAEHAPRHPEMQSGGQKQPRVGDASFHLGTDAGSHERARFVRLSSPINRSASTQSVSKALRSCYASHGGVLWSALVALGGRSAVESISVVADPGRSTTIRDAWIVRIMFADAATAAATHRDVHIDLDGATAQMISTPYRPETHDTLFPTPIKSQPAPSPSPALVADPADRLDGGLKRDWQAVRGRDWRAVLPSHRLTEQPQTRPPQGHQAGAQGTTDSHGH